MRKIKRYGCRPDLRDSRDFLYHESSYDKLVYIPPALSLVDKLPPCWDQGNLGSCTGHGSVGAMVFIHPDKMFSRLDAYFNGRVIEGDEDQDNGAQIRDVVSGLANAGVCTEDLWPYDITTFATPPPEASLCPTKITQYLRCIDLMSVKNSLVQGFPVIIGFTVYSGFEAPDVAATGIVKMPQPGEQVVGGHCVLVIGYDDSKNAVFVRNSWGTQWGINGNFWLPYKFFDSLVSDMWTLRV